MLAAVILAKSAIDAQFNIEPHLGEGDRFNRAVSDVCRHRLPVVHSQ